MMHPSRFVMGKVAYSPHLVEPILEQVRFSCIRRVDSGQR